MMRCTSHITVNAIVVQARLSTNTSIAIAVLADGCVESALQAHGPCGFGLDMVVTRPLEAHGDRTDRVCGGTVRGPRGAIHDGAVNAERLGRRRLSLPESWIALCLWWLSLRQRL